MTTGPSQRLNGSTATPELTMGLHYAQLQHLSPQDFKRFCGVSPHLFEQMLSVLHQAIQQRTKIGGPTKLELEDQLLMTLQYWREYRTYFHLAQDWGLHESTVCRTIHNIETILVSSQQFSLPGKKRLLASDSDFDVVVVDVGEHPIERPKKSRGASTAASRSDIPSKAR